MMEKKEGRGRTILTLNPGGTRPYLEKKEQGKRIQGGKKGLILFGGGGKRKSSTTTK